MLYSVSTHEVMDELSFRALFPNVSFPAILTDELVSEYGYGIVQERGVPTSENGFELVFEDGQMYKVWNKAEFDPQSFERFSSMIVSQLMDSVAREYGYDSILTACTYATSTVPKFQVEGQAFVQYRDAVWVAYYDALGTVDLTTGLDPSTFVKSLMPEFKLPSAS